MKTKVELDISEATIDKATKTEIKKLKKQIKTLENKVTYRDNQITRFKNEVRRLETPRKEARQILLLVAQLIEAAKGMSGDDDYEGSLIYNFDGTLR